MDDLFQRPLLTMWRHAYPTAEETVRHGILNIKHAEQEQEQHDDGGNEYVTGGKRESRVCHVENAA
ncbi:hypothetical protein BDW75DRAFT_203839 [Aspergillus navahoensis]